MKKAIDLAKEAKSINEVPVGAVLVDNLSKEIVSMGYNIVEKEHNATYHAEVVIINKMASLGVKNLQNYSLYVTLEPCAMCATALSHARIGKIYFGAYDEKMGAIDSNLQIYNSKVCYHKPEVYGGFHEKECGDLLKDFFLNIRKLNN